MTRRVSMAVLVALAVALSGAGVAGAAGPSDPIGSIDVIAQVVGGRVQVRGWTLDPDTSESISIDITVDGGALGVVMANEPRPDVGTAFPGKGDNHGFDVLTVVSPGPHQICVTAQNAGPGANTPLGCRAVEVRGPSPYGSLDEVAFVVGGFRARGWAIDPDTAEPIDVQLVVDGVGGQTVKADLTRPDVAAANPGLGDRHGFDVQQSAAIGAHQVCVNAGNVGPGASVLLGCRTVVVRGPEPFGIVDRLVAISGGLQAGGWAIDPDTADPINVLIAIDGGAAQPFVADVSRPDVGAANPGFGDRHGFSVDLAAPIGPHQVCITAVNVGAGASSDLGCRSVIVRSPDPFGSFDEVTAGTQVLLARGWAIDPDTAEPISVQVSVDGGAPRLVPANASRPDVGAANPGFGDNHGFAVEVPVAPGAHQVCVTAVNVGPGNTAGLGCRQVEIRSPDPFGVLDRVTGTSDRLLADGWAIDPDEPSRALEVLVTVDGGTATRASADQPRADVGAANPGAGDNHGYSLSIPAAPGSHQVCVTAVNVGAGSNASLGCASATVPS